MFEVFRSGCELLGGLAQSFWDSLNVFGQILFVVAGVIGASMTLGCAGGWLMGKIARGLRRKHPDPIRAWPTGPLPPVEREEPKQEESREADEQAEGLLSDRAILYLSFARERPTHGLPGETWRDYLLRRELESEKETSRRDQDEMIG